MREGIRAESTFQVMGDFLLGDFLLGDNDQGMECLSVGIANSG